MVGRLCLERELRRQAELEAWVGGLQETGHDGRDPSKGFVWGVAQLHLFLRILVVLEGRTKKQQQVFSLI